MAAVAAKRIESRNAQRPRLGRRSPIPGVSAERNSIAAAETIAEANTYCDASSQSEAKSNGQSKDNAEADTKTDSETHTQGVAQKISFCQSFSETVTGCETDSRKSGERTR